MSTTRLECSAGGVLCKACDGSLWVALIVTHGGHWLQLPKGWLETGETPEQAAQREVEEETGLQGTILEGLGTIDYWFFADRATHVHKFVTFYLMAYRDGDVSDFDSSEVEGVVWLPIEKAIEEASFATEREILRKAQEAWRRLKTSGT